MIPLETLLKLQEAKSLEQIRIDLENALESGTGIAIALPDGFGIKDLESLMPERRMFRGNLSTKDIDAFVGYTEQHHNAATTTAREAVNTAAIFIDQEKMAATAIYDLGDRAHPLHCRHTGSLRMQQTPEFASLMALCGGLNNGGARQISPREFAEYIEDWGDYMTFTNEDDIAVTQKEALQGIRKVKIAEKNETETRTGNLSQGASITEEIKVSGAEGKLPVFIEFTCVAYEGLSMHRIKLRVVVNLGGREPAFKLIVRSPGQTEKDIAFDFSNTLNAKLKAAGCDAVKTTLGVFNSGKE